jgi:hypothetical protein
LTWKHDNHEEGDGTIPEVQSKRTKSLCDVGELQGSRIVHSMICDNICRNVTYASSVLFESIMHTHLAQPCSAAAAKKKKGLPA